MAPLAKKIPDPCFSGSHWARGLCVVQWAPLTWNVFHGAYILVANLKFAASG